MKFKWMSLVSIPVISAGIIPAMALTSCSKEKIKVIVDTDVGNDCDDVGALTILGNAYKKGLVDIKAVTVCNSYLPSFHTTDILLEKYGIDCPMGYDPDGEVYIWQDHDYALAVDEKWDARSEKDPSRMKLAVNVLRKALVDAERGGYKVKLITLGMFDNIADLLASEPDDISPKTGSQLFQANVSEMISMGGRFDDQTYSEFNIKQSLWAAKAVINNENVVPKTFCGWEDGYNVFTGLNFHNKPESPQCVAYKKYNGDKLRESWDPLTMYYALFGAPQYSNWGKVTVEGDTEKVDGRTIFDDTKSGVCRYIPMCPDPAKIALKLESWMEVNE